MKSLGRHLRSLLQMIASDTFTICLFVAVAAATVLAYGFGAEAELIVMILVLGVVTAFAETTIRAHNNKGDSK
jgi:hypothetical protein